MRRNLLLMADNAKIQLTAIGNAILDFEFETTYEEKIM